MTLVLNHFQEKGKSYLLGNSISLDLFAIYWTFRYVVEQDAFLFVFFRAIFSNRLLVVQLLSCVRLFVIPWTVVLTVSIWFCQVHCEIGHITIWPHYVDTAHCV